MIVITYVEFGLFYIGSSCIIVAGLCFDSIFIPLDRSTKSLAILVYIKDGFDVFLNAGLLFFFYYQSIKATKIRDEKEIIILYTRSEDRTSENE